MNMTKAQKIYDRLEETQENIPCIVSTNQIQGKGKIIDARKYLDVITFFVNMESGERVEISCFGVETEVEG